MVWDGVHCLVIGELEEGRREKLEDLSCFVTLLCGSLFFIDCCAIHSLGQGACHIPTYRSISLSVLWYCWHYLKARILDSLEAVFFNSFNTEKWQFGPAIDPPIFVFPKMGGDFTPPFLIVLSLSWKGFCVQYHREFTSFTALRRDWQIAVSLSKEAYERQCTGRGKTHSRQKSLEKVDCKLCGAKVK